MQHILFNKPYNVVCQFSTHPSLRTLADYVDVPGVYPAGRLDADSEGLVLLTSDGALQHTVRHPTRKWPKTYIVQVEGVPDAHALERLRAPLRLKEFTTQGCTARRIAAPDWLWLRTPPIRERREQPTSWLALTIAEGKNRQIRRMTAAVGHPTLRLVRIAIGKFSLETHPLLPGQWCAIEVD